ncbi:MAG: hypothetical protein WDM89_06470 [Rhizomicrobium sp.]
MAQDVELAADNTPWRWRAEALCHTHRAHQAVLMKAMSHVRAAEPGIVAALHVAQCFLCILRGEIEDRMGEMARVEHMLRRDLAYRVKSDKRG